MNFSWEEEQEHYREKVIQFAHEQLNTDILERDRDCVFSMEDWRKCAQFGIQGLAAPSKYGGAKDEIDLLGGAYAMEALGYGCKDNGLSFALNAQMWTVQQPISHFGSEFQKEKYLRPMADGKSIGCHGLTEETAGSDVFNMKTTATKVVGGYLLNGGKRYTTLGPIADIALVFAVTNPDVGKWGVSSFIVETDTEGFIRSENQPKMGLRSVPFGHLTFKDCFVPEENRLGKEGAGWGITIASLEYDRCCILASQLGAMERQLEESIAYVKKRKQFGQAISRFQSVSNRIADMKLRIETSRLLLYKVAWLKSQGKSAMLDAAMLKLQLGESFLASSIDTIRNHGGYGYITENEVERDLRDAMGGVIYAGTSDIQRNIISDLLGL